MEFNPIKYGESVKIDIALNYMKNRGIAFKNFIDRLILEKKNASFHQKMQEFIRIKGPYIESLNLPKISKEKFFQFARNLNQTFSPNGLNHELIRTIEELSIEYLYKFQEKSIIKILNKFDDYLITAPTGRGKTEAWVIPLLDLIISIKKGNIKEYKDKTNYGRIKTKICLIYPTKALAQDQFKRLMEILVILNDKLDESLGSITLGIFDGDTPHKSKFDRHIQDLNNSFGSFDCPNFSNQNIDCLDCNKKLIVKEFRPKNETKRRAVLTTNKEKCEADIDLSFMQLTREDIIDNGVDILITNPDTINYQLININSLDSRSLFILDPIYLVLDEIHIYSGIFGSFVSMIIKRIKTARKKAGLKNSNLYIIGSSATISNKKQHFGKISGNDIDADCIIDSESKIIKKPDMVPYLQTIISIFRRLSNMIITEENIDDCLTSIFREDNDFILIFQRFKENFDILNEKLLQFILSKETPFTLIMRYLHTVLTNKSMSSNEFIEFIINDLELKDTEIVEIFNSENNSNLFVENLYTIGVFCGILENRCHMFVWPLDGIYGCINCGAIYQNYREKCEICDHDFITKVLYCEKCFDIFFESWFCPVCQNLFPMTINNEGLFNKFDSFYCLNEHEELGEVESMKVVWKPQFTCPSCHKQYNKRFIAKCPKCEENHIYSPLEIIDSNKQKSYYCKQCGNSFSESIIKNHEENCYNPNCDGLIKDYSLDNECPECGDLLQNKKLIPWICASCGKRYYSITPPEECENEKCSRSKTFYLDGFFEPRVSYYMPENPKKEYIKPEIEGNKLIQKSNNSNSYSFINQKYRLVRKSPSIEKRNKFFDGKCESSEYRYYRRIGKRFRSFEYTPNFTSNRISQFLLKNYFLNKNLSNLNDKLLEKSKILSFADTIKDMDQLADNFFENEVVNYIDDLTLHKVMKNDDETITLNQLQDKVVESLFDYIDLAFIGQKESVKTSKKWDIYNILQGSYYFLGAKENLFYKKRSNENINSCLKRNIEEIVRRNIINNLNKIRNLTEQGLTNFIIEFPDNISIDDKKFIKKFLTSHRYPRTKKSIEWTEVSNLKQRIKEIEDSIQKKSEKLSNDVLKALENEKRQISNKIEDIYENIRIQLEKLVGNNVLITEGEKYINYFVNPEIIIIKKVNKKNPIYIKNDESLTFLPEFDYDFLDDIEKEKYLKFQSDPLKRIDYLKPFFSYMAYKYNKFHPTLFFSESYKGETKKRIRRWIENSFRSGKNLHYISTGPAMEVGIDIGSLNMMILYGTPPNINSYLQRIGRAGRKSKKSLIVSISNRNPIDYYYFNKPVELINSNEQPVPLNEKNPTVIQTSLNWAILDYITENYKVIWEKEN